MTTEGRDSFKEQVAARVLAESAFGLGPANDPEEIKEVLFWLLSLKEGLSGNEIFKEASRFSRSRGKGIRQQRLTALKRLYVIRETPEFRDHFANYMK